LTEGLPRVRREILDLDGASRVGDLFDSIIHKDKKELEMVN